MKDLSEYILGIQTLINEEKYRAALSLVEEALVIMPEDPFLLSFNGYLEAKIYKNYRQGINTCKDAIVILGPKVPSGKKFYHPLLYLNLGKAYLEAEKKRNAVLAFRKGLSLDSQDKDITLELKKLGERKSPPIPFLDRSNLLNKYIGKMRHKMSKPQPQV